MFDPSNNNESKPSSSNSSSQQSHPCRRFELPEILLATDDFNESLVIGHGGFGNVYKGTLFDGSSTLVDVAIKRLDSMSSQGATEFWAEVEMLSKLRHSHLVSLIGYCNHEEEMILVYEYMPHGTLADHLHKRHTPLSWHQRLKICVGAARGLDYLHTGTGIETGIIHRDVKCSNILLHESWAAKLSDFGLSRIGPTNQPITYVNTIVKGTFGYLDPNYFHTGNLTRKSDVYAFGVVLFEVLCRKPAVIRNLDDEPLGLAPWAQESIKEGKLKHIVDPEIRVGISQKWLKEFVGIAERCLHIIPKQRPTMAEVVFSLESVLSLQEKINNSLPTEGRTMFGRMLDILPFISNGTISGMEFGSFTARTKKQHGVRKKSMDRNVDLLLEDKLRAYGGHGIGVDSIKRFRAEELKEATDNYADHMILARGSYSSVYKGILADTGFIAIKRFISAKGLDMEAFVNEIEVHAQVHHRNVVQLLGCCLETEDLLLVYEFVSNGTLYDHIHNGRSGLLILSWDIRLKIAHESAGALAYLHTDARTSIILKDVRPANILLDENYTAKIKIFGISKLVPMDEYIPEIPGLGYMAPEYIRHGRVTHKVDVYSFGVVLAELLTRKRDFNMKRGVEDKYLATYFVNAKRENRWREILDSQVVEEATDEQLEAMCDLVCRCLDEHDKFRPTMKQVTMELKHVMDIGETFSSSSRQLQRTDNLMSESEQDESRQLQRMDSLNSEDSLMSESELAR